jgi:hypothetical protein
VSTPPLEWPEDEARRVVLVQAIEAADAHGALVSEAEREAAERAVLERRKIAPGERPQPQWYLPERAAEVLRTVQRRHPAVLRLELEQAGWSRLALVLPAIALVLGFASDLVGDPHRLNLLALPLLGFVAWNIAVYLLVLVSLFARGRPGFVDAWLRALAGLPAWLGAPLAGRLRRSVAAQFQLHWWRVAGALEGARVQRILHFSAAAWAVGVMLSLAWHGIGSEYRVGWESTWLQAPQVRWLANAISAPGRAVTQLAPFGTDEIERLHGWPGAGQPLSGRWVLLYIAFLFAVVVLPRLLLAAWSAWRAMRLARAVRVDAGEPYFEQLMARVSPARVGVELVSPEPALLHALQRVLRQAGADPQLATPQHDELREAGELLRADVVWLACTTHAQASQALAAKVGSAAPVILLAGPDVQVTQLDQTLRPLVAEVLPMAATIACWPLEQPLREAVLRHARPWKRAGTERLMQAWAAQHERRWASALHCLGLALARAARDSEPLPSMLPRAKDREQAMGVLLQRLEERLREMHGELLRLYGVEGLSRASGVAAGERSWTTYLVNQGGAGLAGAMAGLGAGALAGAKIDLLTGGLTMGAGAAFGALIGGAGAFGAARFWEWGGKVRLGDEQLQSLAESLLLQYLAVIHAGRLEPETGRWQAEAIAAVAAAAADVQRACKAAREAADEQAAADVLRAPLRAACGALLRSLYPGAPLSLGP